MSIKSFYNNLKIDKSIAEELKFNPYFPLIESGISNTIKINKESFIDLASNDYLGLASNNEVKKAVIEGVEKYGVSMCGTPIATGYSDIFQKIEKRFSSFLNLEDTIIFPSCYQANMSLLPTIVGQNDVIIFDHYVHASMIQSIKSAGCKIKPYKHNDINHLRNVLQRTTKFQQIFVVTESVFSTEGSIAPFDKIVDLCNEFSAIPIIDDSHGIGVIGKHGKGILEHFDINDYNGIYTASLGKSIANAGGIVSGKEKLIDFLRYSCGGLIYSTALPPSIFFGIDKVLDIIEADFSKLSKKIWMARNQIFDILIKSGFNVADGEAPIISVICENPFETIKLAKILYENHILCTPFIPPSVPPDSGVVRLIAGANLTDEQLDKVITIFGDLN